MLVVGSCLLGTSLAGARQPARLVALEGGRILTMDGTVIEEGTVLIANERIEALGSDVQAPSSARLVDARGTTITPGLIDAHSVLGRGTVRATGSGGAPRRAEDAFDRYDTEAIRETLRHGVTAVFVSPEGPPGICGTGAVIRLTGPSDADGPFGSVLARDAALCIDLASASQSVARLKVLQGVRKAFDDALEYRRSLDKYEQDLAKYRQQLDKRGEKEAANKAQSAAADGPRESKSEEKKSGDQPGQQQEAAKKDDSAQPKKPRRPPRNITHEIVLRALDAELPVRVSAHRSGDLLNALELARDYSLNLTLVGATEAHLVAGQIARAEASVILGPLDLPLLRRNDPLRRRLESPGPVLSEAGIVWGVSAGGGRGERSRFVALQAQMAGSVADGLDPLLLATTRAAELLGVAPRIGQLRPESLADLVVWSGDPLEASSKVLRVFVGGEEVFSAVPE